MSSYEEILERVPKVTWTPVPGPDHHDLAQRFEYTEDALRKAAEIVWLYVCGTHGWKSQPLPAEDFYPFTIMTLRKALQGEKVGDNDIPFMVYWQALEIMNLPRTEASSSRRVERPADVADFDPKAEEDAVLAEWVGASAGQG
jgi:hypothetical protein